MGLPDQQVTGCSELRGSLAKRRHPCENICFQQVNILCFFCSKNCLYGQFPTEPLSRFCIFPSLVKVPKTFLLEWTTNLSFKPKQNLCMSYSCLLSVGVDCFCWLTSVLLTVRFPVKPDLPLSSHLLHPRAVLAEVLAIRNEISSCMYEVWSDFASVSSEYLANSFGNIYARFQQSLLLK